MANQDEQFVRGRKSTKRLLDEHKQRGCTVLVVGDVPDDILTTVSSNLLGEPADSPRTRVVGLFDRNMQTVRDRLEGRYGRDPTRVVTTNSCARSATQTASADGGQTDETAPFVRDYSLDPTTVEAHDLETVVSALVSHFDAAKDTDYAPSELRVCIDSLRPVLDTHSDGEVAQFLDTLTTEITDRRGMGHFVLPLPEDSPAVEAIRHHFEVITPLRSKDGTIEQQMVIPQHDNHGPKRETDWMEL